MKAVAWILSVAAILLACAAIMSLPQMFGDPEEATAENQVEVDDFAFTPSTITIAPGTQVKWVNSDDIPHTIVSDDKSFKSKALDTDDAFTYTFTKPGTYTYSCSIHPKMTGKVVVE